MVSGPDMLEVRSDRPPRYDVLLPEQRAIFETVRTPLLLMRPVRGAGGRVTDMVVVAGNAAAAKVNGVRPSELVGRRLRPTVESPEQERLFEAYLDLAEHGGSFRREVSWHHEGRVWARFDISAREDDGHVLVSFRDVMDHESAQQELRAANERLHAAERELAARASAHHDFVAVASHELRTPLATLRGFAELLRNHGSALGAEDVAVALDAIVRNVERQTKIIDSMVDASALVGGDLEVRHYRLDVEPMVRAAIADVPPLAGRTTVEVEDGLTVLGDESRLSQALIALLSNAAKYGGPRVVVTGRSDRRDVILSVEDDGPGVDPAFVPSLFEMFTQDGGALRRTARGAGLGLTLVRGFVQAMDGDVRYLPRDGGGAVFEIRLPRV